MSRPGCGEAEAAVKTGIVYALYLGGLVFGPLAVVGAAVAYLDRTAGERAPVHRRFQIRTAGIGMFQWAVGFVVLVLLIGFDSITSNPGLVLLLLSPVACLALLLWVQQYVWMVPVPVVRMAPAPSAPFEHMPGLLLVLLTALLLWGLFWWTKRCLRGLRCLSRQEPHPNPATWLW